MFWTIKDKMPHITLTECETYNKDNILLAYEDLRTAYSGIHDYIYILDGIRDGIYSVLEVMMAGIILTNGLEGYLLKDNSYIEARYIRINQTDFMVLSDASELFFYDELGGCEFEGENDIRYTFKRKKRSSKKDSQLGRADHLNGSTKSQNKNI